MDPITSFGWDKVNVTTDTIVNPGACIMHSIVLNGVTTVGDIFVYDGVDATGELVATLNIRSAVSVSFQGITFIYDCEMVNGIFIDITSSTFAGNITVTHK